MATIKTTGTGSGLRVLTKTAGEVQRVSCSCCEEAECCMYPADHDWGDGSDLPDAITLILPQGSPLILNAIRNGDEFYVADPVYWSAITFAPDPETGYSPRQYFRIKKEMGTWQTQFIGVPLGEMWIVQYRYEDEQDWPPPSGGGIYFQPCLIIGDGNLTPGDGMVEDQFADTYTYTAVFNGATLESGTLTRESLCVWLSNIEQPLIVGIFYNSDTFRFEQLDANDFGATKSGPSNSPEGEYVVLGDGLYAGGILTVS